MLDKTKLAVMAGGVVVVGALGTLVWWQHSELAHQREALEDSVVQMKQLKDDIVRSQSQYASKQDIENFAKNNGVDLRPIQDDLASLDAQIKGIQNVLVSTPGFVGTNIGSSSVVARTDAPAVLTTIPCPNGGSVQCPNSDPFGYLKSAQVLALNEPFSNGTAVPFGETQFHAWDPKPWDIKIYPRQYSVTTVLGEDENGRHYTYNRFTITSNGKVYPIKIADSKFEEEKPDSKFSFNPRLYMGMDVGTYVHPAIKPEVIPDLEVSLFSYGSTKINPSWTFVGVGVGYASQEHSLAVVLSPVNYNVAQHLPLVKNLHVGPTIALNTSGGFAILGGIRVGL